MSKEARAEIRSQLIQARADLLYWVNSTSRADWEMGDSGSRWSTRQLLARIAQRTDLLASMAAGAANKHSFMNYPQGILSRAEQLVVNINARRLKLPILAEHLSKSYQTALILLEDIPDEDWQNGAKILGRYCTVEQVYRDYLEFIRNRLQELGNIEK